MPRPKKQPTLIGDFPINAKTKNALTKAGIQNSDDFADFTVKDLGSLEGIGPVLWLELKTYLQGAKIKWKKREPKEKKAPKWDPRCRALADKLLDGKINSFAQEIQFAGLLVEEFGFETVDRVVLPSHVTSLRYFFTGSRISHWVQDFMRGFAPIRLLEAPKIDLEDAGGSEEVLEVADAPVAVYIPKTRVPSSLADFLKLRK